MSLRAHEWAAVIVIAFCLTMVTWMRTDRLTSAHPEFHFSYQDHHKYLWMSEHGPFSLRIAPFCWRVFVPAVASALPGSIELNYTVISFVSVWLTAVLLFLLLKKLGFSITSAWLGLLTYFAMAWPTKYLLHNFWNPDAAAYLCVTSALLCIAGRRPVALALTLALGATIKESTMFVAPLFYTLTAERPFDLKAAFRTVVVTLPAVAVLVGLRLIIPQLNGDETYLQQIPEILRHGSATVRYDYSSLAQGMGWTRLNAISARQLEYYTLAPFGALALLPFFAVRRNWSWLVRFAPFLFMVYLQLWFAANTERLIALGFPVIVVLAVTGMEAVASRLGLSAALLMPLPILLWGAELIDPARIGAPIEVQMVLVILAFAMLLQWRARSRGLAGSHDG